MRKNKTKKAKAKCPLKFTIDKNTSVPALVAKKRYQPKSGETITVDIPPASSFDELTKKAAVVCSIRPLFKRELRPVPLYALDLGNGETFSVWSDTPGHVVVKVLRKLKKDLLSATCRYYNQVGDHTGIPRGRSNKSLDCIRKGQLDASFSKI